jgi:hypothetical protein
MDDFVLSNLHESRNEWCGRLVSILTPLVTGGICSIFNEAWKMCQANHELSKYLLTFQTLLARVPKWNSIIIEEEKKRIIEKSGCNYLEDLITCVHIIQLKVLTCIRVGNKQKKIDISIPKLDHFLHSVYIHVARKVYSNTYLFEKNISGLQQQKNLRELEVIIQECILMAIRESIPTEAIIRAYMEEAVEEEEQVIIEPIPDEKEKDEDQKKEDQKKEDQKKEEDLVKKEIEELPPTLTVENINNEIVKTNISFDDVDHISDGTSILAPKTIENLEEKERIRREKEAESDEDGPSGTLQILNDVPLNDMDFEDLSAEVPSQLQLDGVEDL